MSACWASSPRFDDFAVTARLRIANLRSRVAGPFELAVEPGECVAITGASGSGKSLLLRMIADLDPNEGEALLDGRERHRFHAPEWRRQVVYSAAEPGWWGELPLDHFPASEHARVLALADRLGIAPERAGDTLTRLSTGERQRLALIRALLLDPPVLLLDEPTGALDTAATACVETVLLELLAGGTAMLVVTHSAEQAARLGNRRFHMAERRLSPA
jgi:putative ABC transport system ATP-binding protein